MLSYSYYHIIFLDIGSISGFRWLADVSSKFDSGFVKCYTDLGIGIVNDFGMVVSMVHQDLKQTVLHDQDRFREKSIQDLKIDANANWDFTERALSPGR